MERAHTKKVRVSESGIDQGRDDGANDNNEVAEALTNISRRRVVVWMQEQV